MPSEEKRLLFSGEEATEGQQVVVFTFRRLLTEPMIRGTRIPVGFIFRRLDEGATEAGPLHGNAGLTREYIQAALAYAADSLAHQTILLRPA